eukprot:SAG11_NODE_19950_length_453_cov_2.429775_1_plen_64_part_01
MEWGIAMANAYKVADYELYWHLMVYSALHGTRTRGKCFKSNGLRESELGRAAGRDEMGAFKRRR